MSHQHVVLHNVMEHAKKINNKKKILAHPTTTFPAFTHNTAL
jgi:hypothetical protein